MSLASLRAWQHWTRIAVVGFDTKRAREGVLVR